MKILSILFSFTLSFIGVIVAVHYNNTIGMLLATGGMLMLLTSLPNNNNK